MNLTHGVDRPMIQMSDGVRRRSMVWGEEMLLAEIHLDTDGVVPSHDHVYEQLGYCFHGRFELTVGEETQVVTGGMSWAIPGGVTHSAKGLEPTFLIEIWSPARDDYKD